MVIPNWIPPKPPADPIQYSDKYNLKAMARPADRMAAVVIDLLIVLLPIYLLLSAPLKLHVTTSLMLGSDVGVFVFAFLSGALAICILLFYQAFMHSRYGATIGKMIFHLQIRNVWNDGRPDLLTSLKRAVIWSLEILLLGLPWLGIFTNSQRRMLHDRICDTEVISLKEKGVRPPQIMERRFVYGVLGLFAFFVGMSLVASGMQSLRSVSQERSISSLLSKEGRSCEAVNEALQKMNDLENASGISRLQIAMTLYAAGAVEKSCLAEESEQLMDINFDASPLSYLAKAFVYSDDPEISDAYLDQVCKEDSSGAECSMSELVSRWSEEDWAGVEKAIADSKSGSGYMEVWAIRHFIKQGQFAQAMAFIDKLSPNIVVGSFLQTQRVKALWGLQRPVDAEIATVQALDSLPLSEQKSLAAYSCFEQLQQSCVAIEQRSCEFLKRNLKSDELDTSEASVGLAELKFQECKDPSAISYTSLADKIDDESWKLFLRASDKANKNDRDSAAGLFAQVLKFSEAPDEVRLEAMNRFLSVASGDDVLDIVASWRELKSGELWRKAGQSLLSHLVATHQKVAALKVARSLLNQKGLSEKNLSELTAYIEIPMPQVDAAKVSPRSPASVGEDQSIHENIRSLLESISDDETEVEP